MELNARAVEANKQALAWGRLAVHDLAAVEEAARPARRDEALPEPSLEALVERRCEFLTGYQSRRTARRYRRLVERVRDRERALGDGRDDLARAVARNYAKLIAYKDEYEVARLFSDGVFQAQVEAEFEGDYRLEWHAAPPHLPVLDWFLDRRDPATGRTRKITFGPWIFAFQRLLAKGRFLRGTPFDPFGRTEHRRLERQLVADYERLVDELLGGLGPANRDLAVEIADMPEHVRGFEMVKETQLETAREKQREQLEAFRRMASA
jgi:indolepyruvate ferredoxin oxidoreductase